MKNPLTSITKLFKNSTRARLALAFFILVLIIVGVFLFFRYLTGSNGAGQSQLSSVPSKNLRQSSNDMRAANQQYIQTLLQSQQQSAKKALQTGQTEIPGIVAAKEQTGGQGYQAGSQNVQTQSQQASTNNQDPNSLVSQMAKNGNISQETAEKLKKLNNENLSPQAYKKHLQKLVREGKISPAQAKKLEQAYNKKHGGSQKDQSTSGSSSQSSSPDSLVDQMAKDGNISKDTAQKLKKLNNEGLSPSQYKKHLQKLVREGKISPEQAKKLEQAYNKKHGGSSAGGSSAGGSSAGGSSAGGSSSNGESTADQLKKLKNQNLSPSQYKKRLQQLVKEGKISPEQAKKLEQAYNKQHGGQSGESGSQAAINKLKKQNLSPQQLSNALNKLVQEGKISPEKARELLQNSANFGQGTGSANQNNKQKFKKMLNNNVTPLDYAKQLNEAVKNDQLTPEEAEKALENYKTFYNNKQQEQKAQQKPPQNKNQEKLQQDVSKLKQQQRERQRQKLKKQEQKLQQKSHKQIAEKQKQIAKAMSNQMNQLINSWKPANQKLAGQFSEPSSSSSSSSSSKHSSSKQGGGSSAANSSGNNNQQSNSSKAGKKPTIRAGDILFAVLDTGINTDEKGPIMASIVNGKYRGAKLMGNIQVSSDHESVKLKFNRMIMPQWRKSQSISALAIDPETAHTALASSVNHHYLVRFGSLIASSFLEGLGKAIKNSGKTSVSSQGQTTQTTQDFNAAESALIGLGEVGKKMSSSAKKEFNRKPTVKVDAGTALGVLFMNDVTIKQGAGQSSKQSSRMNSR